MQVERFVVQLIWRACSDMTMDIAKSGERVSNTWETYLLAGDNIWKQMLIPYNNDNRMVVIWKMVLLSLRDGPAVH